LIRTTCPVHVEKIVNGGTMKIAIGADHRGFHFKQIMMQDYGKPTYGRHVDWLDAGCFTAERCDYPEFAKKVVQEIKKGEANLGILICGSGVGMAIAANRYPGIYAALVWNETTAHLAREHDGANILVIPADFVSSHDALRMVHAWLEAKFLAERYQKRLEMIDAN